MMMSFNLILPRGRGNRKAFALLLFAISFVVAVVLAGRMMKIMTVKEEDTFYGRTSSSSHSLPTISSALWDAVWEPTLSTTYKLSIIKEKDDDDDDDDNYDGEEEKKKKKEVVEETKNDTSSSSIIDFIKSKIFKDRYIIHQDDDVENSKDNGVGVGVTTKPYSLKKKNPSSGTNPIKEDNDDDGNKVNGNDKTLFHSNHKIIRKTTDIKKNDGHYGIVEVVGSQSASISSFWNSIWKKASLSLQNKDEEEEEDGEAAAEEEGGDENKELKRNQMPTDETLLLTSFPSSTFDFLIESKMYQDRSNDNGDDNILVVVGHDDTKDWMEEKYVSSDGIHVKQEKEDDNDDHNNDDQNHDSTKAKYLQSHKNIKDEENGHGIYHSLQTFIQQVMNYSKTKLYGTSTEFVIIKKKQISTSSDEDHEQEQELDNFKYSKMNEKNDNNKEEREKVNEGARNLRKNHRSSTSNIISSTSSNLMSSSTLKPNKLNPNYFKVQNDYHHKDIFSSFTNKIIKNQNRLLQTGDDATSTTTSLICSNISDTFQTSYVIIFAGNASLVTEEKANLLAVTFATSYNNERSQSSNKCDPLFRTIKEVKITTNASLTGANKGEILENPLPIIAVRKLEQHLRDRDSSPLMDGMLWESLLEIRRVSQGKDGLYRQLQEQQDSFTSVLNGTIANYDVGLLLLDIFGVCRGCRGNTIGFDLFDDTTVIQQQQERRRLQDEDSVADNDCICPEDAVAADVTGFQSAFNNNVEDLRDTGELDFVEELDEIIPIVEAKCPTTEQDFSSVFLVRNVVFSRTLLLSLGVEGVKEIQTLFQNSYNGVAQQLCDPLYRAISKVQLVSIEQEQEGSRTVQFEFVVEATCRGDNCIDAGCIFDEVDSCGESQRRERKLQAKVDIPQQEPIMTTSTNKISPPRHLQKEQQDGNEEEGERCFCRKGRSIRPPSPQEVRLAFQTGLDVITEKNKLSSCQDCSFPSDCQSGVCSVGRCAEEDTQLLLNTCICGSSEECESGFCQQEAPPPGMNVEQGGTCQGKLASCRGCNTGDECLSGFCTAGRCAEAKDGKLKTGCACTSNAICQTGRCVDDITTAGFLGKCTEKINNTCTEPCLSSSDCATGLCGSVVCLPFNGTLLAEGCWTTLSTECKSGVSENNICTLQEPSTPPSSVPTTKPSNDTSTGPSSQPSTSPSNGPSGDPSAGPSSRPSSTPSTRPSGEPSAGPSSRPTTGPSTTPSTGPSGEPSARPSRRPTTGPSTTPSTGPSGEPSTGPSIHPSTKPSSEPTFQPSMQPSKDPSTSPTLPPSNLPSTDPSAGPSTGPSKEPSTSPTQFPSASPSSLPTLSPSTSPSTSPSISPTTSPSSLPSGSPSAAPSALEDCRTFPAGESSHNDVMSFCNAHVGEECCVGTNACTGWNHELSTYTICKNSCSTTFDNACYQLGFTSRGAVFNIRQDSCRGQSACQFLGHRARSTVSINSGSCLGGGSCIYFGYEVQGFITIGSNSCLGVAACREFNRYANFINLAPNSCRTSYSCDQA